MRVYQGMTFADAVWRIIEDFSVAARPVDVGNWQGLDIRGDASKVTWELREASLVVGIPDSMSEAQALIRPNLPWAEDHFNERVSGQPLNPPPSNEWWPFAQAGHVDHLKGGKFSHTYPERFWPKHAADDPWPKFGIRFAYGDLDDVVARLAKNPLTRQAYLPVWFPEDTGAPEGERVPCTLGYHFMVREGKLHVTYHMRACDFMRHFRDDVYLAMRLGQFVKECVPQDVTMGELTMHIGSFHIFEGDKAMLAHMRRQAQLDRNARIREALS